MSTWEERMTARADARRLARLPDDPEARVYGDLGSLLPPGICRECYGERYRWAGNAWMAIHKPHEGRCSHECHIGELPMAATGHMAGIT